MKTSLKILTLSALFIFSANGIAQQAHHQMPAGDMEGKGMQHDMSNMDPAKMDEHMRKKQEHMLMMHDLSNKILAEKDPKKQQALKDQQIELMKAHHMQMMSMHHGKAMDHKKMQ